MTPEGKAAALVLKYEILINNDFVSDPNWHDPMDKNRQRRVKKDAKKCALIVADEVIGQNNIWMESGAKGTNNYWEAVKKEIEKL